MADGSSRFALPLLAPGQAQKEMFHNEALAIVDAIAHPRAVTIGDVTPPSSRSAGECWIVGLGPVGEWSGRADTLACWTDGGWRFVAPVDGMTVWVAAQGVEARFVAGSWRLGEIAASRIVVDGKQVIGARCASIGSPSGGVTVDSEARSSIAAILSALGKHGLIAT